MTDYQFYKRMGICPQCTKNKLFGTESRCPECRAYVAERVTRLREKNRENARKYQRDYMQKIGNERRENGQCYVCGKQLTDLKYKACAMCRAKKNTWQKQRNLRLG